MYKQIPIYEYDGLVRVRVIGYDQNMVQRISDTAYIPFDPANTDYQAYLKWLEESPDNQPLPADE